MGNTQAQNKRRFSGSDDLRSYSSTPPYVNVTAPPSKRRNLQSLSDLSHSAPGVIPLSDSDDSATDNAIKEATSMLRAASLRDTINHRRSSFNESFKSVTDDSGFPFSIDDGASFEDKLYQAELNFLLQSHESQQKDKLPEPFEKDSERLFPTVFRWDGGGSDIYVSGTFNSWKTRIPMVKRNSGIYAIIDCKPGVHEYKYFIDGAWYHDPTKPTVDNGFGTKNNVVHVKSSDFDVLDALEQDQASSRNRAKISDSSDNFASLSQSPPGEYSRVIPSFPYELKRSRIADQEIGPVMPSLGTITQPPSLPPHLLQGILNMDTSIRCDPNLLPPPNHVIVNHLYALSIKDGVIVLSVISRFRQKFVSTLFYKPIDN